MQSDGLVDIAETGCGKSIAYVVHMLINIQAPCGELPGEGPMVLVLVPQRSLSIELFLFPQNAVQSSFKTMSYGLFDVFRTSMITTYTHSSAIS